MDCKEIIDSIISILKVIISWPLAFFILVIILRKEIKTILLDLVKRLKKAPGGWEFKDLSEVKAGVALLVNNSESESDKNKLDQKIDPYSIRLKHTSEQIDEKHWKVKVWLDAPVEFLQDVQKIIYERHFTFKNRYFETTVSPFIDTFNCWGEFTIKAQIFFNNGKNIRRQRYLSLDINNENYQNEH